MQNNIEWTFSDQDAWSQFPKCNDQLSPLDINTDTVETCNLLCKLSLDYKPGKCKISNKNNLVTIKYGEGSKIKFKNQVYNLEKITFHTPSLHKINGNSYDLEVCMFHSFGTNKPNDFNNGIIISALFNEGPNSGKCSMFFNDFINDIPAKNNLNEIDVKVWKNWSANLLIPSKRSFFLYDGSLPFPPCTDKYKFIVFDNVETVSKSILDTIKYNIGSNSTSTKPLGDRIVYYNPISTESFEKPKRNFDIIKEDKYLRCVKTNQKAPEVKKIKKKSKLEDKDLDKDTERKIRNYFLLTIILLIFLTCLFIVKWLYKYEHMVRFLNNIAGKIVGGNMTKKALFNINQMYNSRFN